MADSSVPARFPSTLWSEVLALQRDDAPRRRERLGQLIERYWRPVYWALRADGRLQEAEARDLTQEFFLRILEGDVIETVDPARGSFRSYLKGALHHFLLNARRNSRAEKRGGDRLHLSLDFATAGDIPAALEPDPERALDQAWTMQILDESLKELESRLGSAGKSAHAELFRSYEMAAGERPSYADLASRFGIAAADVRTILRACRRDLRRILLERVSDYVRDEAELSGELRELFGL